MRDYDAIGFALDGEDGEGMRGLFWKLWRGAVSGRDGRLLCVRCHNAGKPSLGFDIERLDGKVYLQCRREGCGYRERFTA